MSFLLLAALGLALSSLAAAEDSSPSTEPEDLVVVTATRLPQPTDEVPSSVTVLTVEEVKAAGATTVGEALALAATPVPVVSQGQGPGSLATLNLQGAASTQVQVLVDGRAVSSALGPVDLSLLPLDDMERIEIVKGPVSALYGANAMGGVINVITRRPSAERQTQVDLSAGGFGEHKLGFSTSDALGTGSYLISARVEGADGWRQNSDSSAQSFSGKLNWRALDGEATVRASYSSAHSGSPGGDGKYIDVGGPTPLARRSDDTGNLDLTYQSTAESNAFARLYATGSTWSYDNPDWFVHSLHHAVFGGAEARRSWVAGSHRLTLAGDYRFDTGTSTNFTGEQRSTNLGLSGEDLYQAGPALSLTLGARLDAHSIYGQVVSPRVGAKYRLGEKSRLWASVGRAYRAPSFEDLYWKDPWDVGNPNLRPETATVYEGGLTLGSMDVTMFQKDVADNITWVFNPALADAEAPRGKYQVQNLNAARFRGVELAYRHSFTDWLSAQATYSWLDPVNADTSKKLPKRATSQGSLALNLGLPHGWQGTVIMKAVGPMSENEDNTVEAPGWTRTDLSLKRSFGENISWQVRLENALNAPYQEAPGYPMPGSSLSTSLSYRF